MSDTLKPENDGQLLDAIKWAISEKTPLEVISGGSKRAYGRPTQTAATLDVSGLAKIETYEPAELYMTAQAGTRMRDIDAALLDAGQQLSFEPPDLGPLMGVSENAATLGGIVATNLAGPRRIKEGAARDHVLGFNAVSGRGEVFKSGGTVVKNVTGFDMSKLMAGSFGTLGVMSTITVKVLPMPEKVRTLLIRWGDHASADRSAMAAMSQALGSAHDVSSAAHLPASIAKRSGVEYVNASGGSITALRLEGPEPSVKHRTTVLRDELKGFADIEELHTTNSATLWREIRDVQPFVGRDDLPYVWRLSVPPTNGAEVAATILKDVDGKVFYDWGGGLIWLAMATLPHAGAELIRAALMETGGHATLVRAPSDIRGNVPVFQPLSGPEAMVTAKIKEGFDPDGILNPGRMYAGI